MTLQRNATEEAPKIIPLTTTVSNPTPSPLSDNEALEEAEVELEEVEVVVWPLELVVDTAVIVDCEFPDVLATTPAPLGNVPVEIGKIWVITSPLSVRVEVDPSSRTSSSTHSPLAEAVKWQSRPPPSCVEPAAVVVGKLDWTHPEAETTTVSVKSKKKCVG